VANKGGYKHLCFEYLRANVHEVDLKGVGVPMERSWVLRRSRISGEAQCIEKNRVESEEIRWRGGTGFRVGKRVLRWTVPIQLP
jgi:hypothetical protein